jgi:hypothetical protein
VRESVEAMIALTVAAGAAGIIIGVGAATSADVVVAYAPLIITICFLIIMTGQVTERVVNRGKIPDVGITVDTPNNATTIF